MTDQSQVLIDEVISQAINRQFVTDKKTSVGGGSINEAFIIESKNQSFFLKINALNYAAMFSAEADGLTELQSPNVIRVPQVICFGETKTDSFLVLEKLVLRNANKASAELLGRQLANLHQKTSKQFGWFRDNTIGSTPQINTRSNDWIKFYRKHRLEYQLSLAKTRGFDGELQTLGSDLCHKLPQFFETYQPYPALLHGDLWSGNYAYTGDAVPVIFDPATYYGDRETDIAMTELFGGFPDAFYQGYNEILPLDEGYRERKNLYNLYHILNHLNLFGSGYYSQAVSMMRGLL